MKKKFLAVLTACAFALALVAVPVSADAQSAPESARKACVNKVGGIAGQKAVNNSSGDLKVRAGKKAVVTISFGLWVFYSDCGNGNRVTSLTYQVDPNPNQCGRIQNFQINPNVIGAWNPGNWTATCNGSDSYSVNRANPNSTFIFDTAPANERCISFSFKVALSGASDATGNAGTSFCLT